MAGVDRALAQPALVLLLCVLLSTAAIAADLAPPADPDLARLRQELPRTIPELDPANIRPSDVPGFYEIRVNGDYGYVGRDGRFLFAGDLIDLKHGERLTETRRRADRLAAIAPLQASAIVYAPAAPRRTITVFTDVGCGYCRALHRQMADINAQGIAVRYLFFPRSGPGSDSYDQARAVLCAADPRDALTRAMGGGKPGRASRNCGDPVGAQYRLAKQLRLQATPAIVLPDGELSYGFSGVDALLERLAPTSRTVTE